MIAFNFQPMDNTEDVAIQDFVQNKSDLVAGNGLQTADQIQVWNGQKFTTYFYRANSTSRPKFSLGPCWVDNADAGTPTSAKIKRGSGVWFVRPESASAGAITVSGAINAASKTHDIVAGYNMISSAFPCDMKLNGGNIDWEACGAVAGNGLQTADQIQVWNGQKFTTYFYRANSTSRPKFSLGPCWVDNADAGTPATSAVPAGKGFWYVRPDGKDAGTIIETSPIAK